MTAESPETLQRHGPPSAWGKGLRLAAGFLLLLAFSEVLWLWQTWPVRELLQPVPETIPLASGR